MTHCEFMKRVVAWERLLAECFMPASRCLITQAPLRQGLALPAGQAQRSSKQAAPASSTSSKHFNMLAAADVRTKQQKARRRKKAHHPRQLSQ
jgi:hypothetical protein